MSHDNFKQRHLLFNMATGSGKTLMMASLILYAYTQGYRNFLFFVNSNNIILKTRSNFLESKSSKYLFKNPIVINGHRVPVRSISNFNESQNDAINICMTTIQGLHTSLIDEKENSFTFSDFKKYKIVMLGDEAHHFNQTTKEKDKKDTIKLFDIDNKNWESTILKIFSSHQENLFLEFTATIDWDSNSIKQKYIPKTIFEYALREFRKDKHSKELDVLQSNLNTEQLMLQAVILSEYRRALSMKYNIPHYKPIILFKSKYVNPSKKEPKVSTSEENQKRFNKMIARLSITDITHLMPTIESFTGFNNDIVKQALEFFNQKYDGNLEELVSQIKDQFSPRYLLNVNNKEITEKTTKKERQEQEKQGYYINTLEDPTNPFRAVFAVDKLNEGWDVLNLFDIVRLYNTRDANHKKNKAGKTTITEAQLIGRGARYYPFKTEEWENEYIRKYDELKDDERRILETLYYHSEHNPEYISELKEELIRQGFMEDYEIKILQIQEDWHKKLEKKQVYSNEKVKRNKEKSLDKYRQFLEILNEKLKKQNLVHRIKTGERQDTKLLEKNTLKDSSIDYASKKIANHLSSDEIDEEQKNQICLCAWLSQNINFSKYKDVIVNTQQFLKDLRFEFTLEYVTKQYSSINWHKEYYEALETKVYPKIIKILAQGYSEYCGTECFTQKPLLKIFTPRAKKVKKLESKKNNHIDNLPPFFAQNFLSYDSELEKEFLYDMQDLYEDLIRKGYKDITLLRNDQQVALYHFDNGKAFYPDFILFCTLPNKKDLVLQLFLEVKGDHLKEHDRWKEEFLLDLEKKAVYQYKTGHYKVLGMEFYTEYNQASFLSQLKTKIKNTI